MSKVIINRGCEYSSIDGVIVKTIEATKAYLAALKLGRAKLLADNETTLMYEIQK